MEVLSGISCALKIIIPFLYHVLKSPVSSANSRGAPCAELLVTYLSLTLTYFTLIEILLSVTTVYVRSYNRYLSGLRALLSGEAPDVRGCMFHVRLKLKKSN